MRSTGTSRVTGDLGQAPAHHATLAVQEPRGDLAHLLGLHLTMAIAAVEGVTPIGVDRPAAELLGQTADGLRIEGFAGEQHGLGALVLLVAEPAGRQELELGVDGLLEGLGVDPRAGLGHQPEEAALHPRVVAGRDVDRQPGVVHQLALHARVAAAGQGGHDVVQGVVVPPAAGGAGPEHQEPATLVGPGHAQPDLAEDLDHRRARRVDALALGPGRDRAEVLADRLEGGARPHVAGDDQGGVAGVVEALVVVAHRVHVERLEGVPVADDRTTVGVALAQLLLDAPREHPPRIVLAHGQFLEDHVALAGELRRIEGQVAHAVRLDLEGALPTVAGELEPIGRVVVAGERVVRAAQLGAQAVDFTLPEALRALEHHVLEEVADPRAFGGLVERADPVVEQHRDHRIRMPLGDQDAQAVAQAVLVDPRAAALVVRGLGRTLAPPGAAISRGLGSRTAGRGSSGALRSRATVGRCARFGRGKAIGVR
jgi:hypothetical protein